MLVPIPLRVVKPQRLGAKQPEQVPGGATSASLDRQNSRSAAGVLMRGPEIGALRIWSAPKWGQIMTETKWLARRSSKGAVIATAVMALGLCVSGAAQASVIYLQDFSTNTNGWTPSSNISLAGPSGSSDGQYAVVTNTDDAYQSGYGSGGYTYFGGESATYVGPFTQSVDIYVDTGWDAPSNASVAAFWLDISPASATTGSNYAAENSFNFYVPGTGGVNISATGSGNADWTITQSGWYTFAMTFSKGASATDPVNIDLNVSTQAGTSLGTVHRVANDALGFNPDSSNLGTGGYAWLTTWQNGFAGDQLKIDNLRSAIRAVPAPLTLPGSGLVLLGLSWLGLAIYRRRQGVAT